ncbi:carbamoyltransferase HypF [Desulfobulbus sp.]|uniref:carbamoyltransferase HypF n=1 Tax=Desulfobulbus sp. TaxID=895 RepID=UPI00286F77A3|nr:carbamoyltransferase HypF [Desulfobulbus sp.]
MTVASQSASCPLRALHISVHGMVQGVGFRPFVYRLAVQHGLNGTVANNSDGVAIHIGGPSEALARFVEALRAEAPPMARIGRIETSRAESLPMATGGETGFRILPSRHGARPSTQIAPDIALCADCQREILDPANRRFCYPFTNCTNCGPRFTIVKHIPYDRPNTSMACFPMCEACSREYHDPLDRRFHAQPNACPVCGPRLSWHDGEGRPLPGDCLPLAAQALANGQVVAIKGLGGFHLAVDGGSEAAVATLRQRKARPAKPLAIMVRDLVAARRYCRLSDTEEALLASPERPIVLVSRKERAGLAEGVAPGLDRVGVMLAYTPLHFLLLSQAASPRALVMTSGNRSDEPICTANDEALRRLHGLADFFLLHDREIVTRVDDSVARIMDGRIRLLRRARGYSPVPVPLGRPTADILACGGEMKNTFCIVRGNEAYLSQHIGELTEAAQFDFFRESVDHLQAVLETTPARTACDLHPDYLSSRYARGRTTDCCAVQHHHAHIGAVMAEHNLAGPVVGLVLDGAGHGGDGTVFGGEVYRADRGGFVRLARLAHLPLPGGDRAATQPWRMGMALLHRGLGPEALDQPGLPPSLATVDHTARRIIGQMLAKGVHCPPTSSCGRLFDAIAALLGLCLESSYEGQAAMLLECQAGLATDDEAAPVYPVALGEDSGLLVIESAHLAELLCRDLRAGTPLPVLARRFHLWLAASLEAAVARVCRHPRLDEVVLAGGCMQNRLLYETLALRLRQIGCTVYGGEKVPMNDGGLALGQAYTGGFSCV